MINGWDLLEPARRRGAPFVRAVVRFGENAREVPIGQLESVLSAQIYQTDFTPDDPETENSSFDFVVWDADGRMWYRGIRDGLVELAWRWATPEAWLRGHGVPQTDRDTLLANLDRLVVDIRSLEDIDALREVVEYIDRVVTAVWPWPNDGEMPADVADAIEREVTPPLVVAPEGLPDSAAERLQQLADAGGRVALDVGDLTPEELELIADSEIPPELQWQSDGVPTDYVPVIDGPLETEEQIEAEAVAATRYLRLVEIAERMTGIEGDVAAIEAVLEIARDYVRRRDE